MFMSDEIRAIRERDPAARNIFEVFLYPSLHVLALHRLAHRLYRAGVPFFPRLISQFARFITGIEIHPGAKIGRGLFIDHGMGVVIGETAEIGDNVTLYQGVTLGGTGKETGKRHPTLGNNVLVGVGAKVLGAITIGDNARIGGGAVVLKDVPPNATAIGIPAKVVGIRDAAGESGQRVENMPDPEGELLSALQEKSYLLEERLQQLLDDKITAHEADHLATDGVEAHLSRLDDKIGRIEKALLALESGLLKNNLKNGNRNSRGEPEPRLPLTTEEAIIRDA